MTEKEKKNKTGMNVSVPEKPEGAFDKKCPFYGNLNVKKKTFIGKVVSDKMFRTVIVEWERRKYIPKYERYLKRKTRIAAHNPDAISAKIGDKVKIVQTRPISKTKSFVIIEKVE